MIRKAAELSTHIIFIGSSDGKELFVAARATRGRSIVMSCHEPRRQAVRKLSTLRRLGLIPRDTKIHCDAVVPENWIVGNVRADFIDRGHLSSFQRSSQEGSVADSRQSANGEVRLTSLQRATANIPDRARIFLAMDIEGMEVKILPEFCGAEAKRFSSIFIAAEMHPQPGGEDCLFLRKMAEEGFEARLVETAAGSDQTVSKILKRSRAKSAAGRSLYENVSQEQLVELVCGNRDGATVGGDVPPKVVRSVLWGKEKALLL